MVWSRCGRVSISGQESPANRSISPRASHRARSPQRGSRGSRACMRRRPGGPDWGPGPHAGYDTASMRTCVRDLRRASRRAPSTRARCREPHRRRASRVRDPLHNAGVPAPDARRPERRPGSNASSASASAQPSRLRTRTHDNQRYVKFEFGRQKTSQTPTPRTKHLLFSHGTQVNHYTTSYNDPILGPVSCTGVQQMKVKKATQDSFTCTSTSGLPLTNQTPGQPPHASGLPLGLGRQRDADVQHHGTVSADGMSYTAVAIYPAV